MRYSHTFLVGSSGTPTQNGAALLAAMTTISNSNPSATNPYLLKLEPGQYDLGNQSLKLLPYLDLEGSGEGPTLISSTISSPATPPLNATLVAASNSEVRFLNVSNAGSDFFQVAVYVPTNTTNVRFVHLTASANLAGAKAAALYNSGTSQLENSTLSAANSTTDNYALFNSPGTTVTLQSSKLTAKGGTFTYGLYNLGTATLQNNTLTVSGASQANNGIYNTASGTFLNSSISATGTSSSYGLVNAGAATVQNSTLSAVGGNNAVSNTLYTTAGTVIVQNSTISASSSSFAIYIDSATVKVGGSQISATVTYFIVHPQSSQLVCVASYDTNFQPLPVSC